MKFDQPRNRWKYYGTRALLAATVAGGGLTAATAVAGASTAHSSTAAHVKHEVRPKVGANGAPGGMPGQVITVTSITSTTLVGTDPSGTSHTFTLTDSTTYTEGTTSETASDVAVGDQVMVIPTKATASATTPTAASVNIVLPFVAGTVVSTSTSGSTTTIVVEDQSGFWRTITTSASTTYTDDGTATTSPSITVGTFIAATGTVDADHTTLDATSIAIGKPTAPSSDSSSSSARPEGPPPGGDPGGGPGGGGPGGDA